MERRAKIVCTIGPACRDAATLEKLLEAGMDVARLNFSHGSAREHETRCKMLRRLKKNVTVVQDLAGPKIRIGEMRGGRAFLRDGEAFTLTTKEIVGDEKQAQVTYPAFPSDVSRGDDIYLADGLIRLEVEQVRGRDVRCRIAHGGMLTSRKGVNLPGVHIGAPALTRKDLADLEFGLAMGVDYVALSFVRNAAEVKRLKDIIKKRRSPALVIAKIEKQEALDRIDAIIDASDALMVARGDLGVEISLEEVPVVQKSIIARCREKGKSVIIATQMLESMVSAERPTRAEASDIANAVFDGADALMLSAETATGQFPVESVAMMDRIIRTAEKYRRSVASCGPEKPQNPGDLVDAVCAGAVQVAREIEASAIACLTHSGRTARMLAKQRPAVPIVALTGSSAVIRQIGLLWGVTAIHIGNIARTDAVFSVVKSKMKEMGLKGRIVMTAGIPTPKKGPTNTVHIIDT